MFLTRGITFTYEVVRETKLTPALAENLRRKRKAGSVAAGISMKRTSECAANGGICIGRSIVTAPGSMSC